MLRKILVLLLIITCLISSLYAGGNRWISKPPIGSQIDWSHPLTKGLVGCWLMNERGGTKVNDLANRSVNSAFTGSWIVDQNGSAWANSISTDRITIDRNSKLEPQQLSIVTSFKQRSNPPSYSVICDKANTSHADPYYSYHLRLDTNVSISSIIVPAAYANRNECVYTVTLTNNKLYQVANTFNGVDNKLYLDTKLGATVSKAVTINYVNTPLIIGNFRNLNHQGNHNIYYLYLYNRALTPSEIQQLYQDPYCFINPPTIWSKFSTAVAAARRFFIFD